MEVFASDSHSLSRSPLARLLALSVLSVTLSMVGCSSDSDKPDPVEPPVVVEPDPVQPPAVSEDLPAVVTGTVFDGKSGAIVDVVTLAFKENGAAATNVLDLDGNVITELTTTDGSFEVTIASDATIDGFTIVTSAEGYLDQSRFVAVDPEAASISAQIELAPAVAVSNVATTQADAAVADATASEAIVVSTAAPDDDATETTVGNAEIAVAVGTQLQDSDGNAVSGDSVSISVAFIEEATTADGEEPAEDSTSVAEAIPAGLNTVESDETADSVSVPLAAATVNIQTNTGANVKKFSTPITLTFNLPATTFVRSAGRVVQAGDNFSVKSFDEDTGEWLLEPNTALVGALAGSVFPATFEVDHLTTFAVTDQVPACQAETTVSFDGDVVPAGTILNVTLRSADVRATFSSVGGNAVVVSAADAKQSGISATLVADSWTVTDLDRNTWGSASSTGVICGSSNTITLTNPVPDTVGEALELTAVCSSDTTVTAALTGALVKYRLDDTKPFKVASGNGDGTYSLVDLVSGSQYAVTVDPRSDVAENASPEQITITADGTTESLQIPVTCSTGTGANG